MPTHTKNAQADGFRVHAIWDPTEAERLFGALATEVAEVVAR